MKGQTTQYTHHIQLPVNQVQLITKFEPAFDRRDEGYGYNGVVLKMIVVGKKGTVHFVLFTNWNLDHIPDREAKPIEVGYFSLNKPMYDKQPKTDVCPYTGERCYYDGFEDQAREAFKLLKLEGDIGVWRYLIKKYKEVLA